MACFNIIPPNFILFIILIYKYDLIIKKMSNQIIPKYKLQSYFYDILYNIYDFFFKLYLPQQITYT